MIPARARDFLQASAALEFWDTYRTSDNNMLENCLRVTVGTKDENQAFLNALTHALQNC